MDAIDLDGDALTFTVQGVQGVGAGASWWFVGSDLYTNTRYNRQLHQLSTVTVTVSDGKLSQAYSFGIEWLLDPNGPEMLRTVPDDAYPDDGGDVMPLGDRPFAFADRGSSEDPSSEPTWLGGRAPRYGSDTTDLDVFRRPIADGHDGPLWRMHAEEALGQQDASPFTALSAPPELALV